VYKRKLSANHEHHSGKESVVLTNKNSLLLNLVRKHEFLPVSLGNVSVSLYWGTMNTWASADVALNIKPSIMNIITHLEEVIVI
jgi:hypothetical protein